MSNPRIVTWAAAGAAALMGAIAAWIIISSPGSVDDVGGYRPPSGTPGASIEVTVEAGAGPGLIADQLEAAGVIESATQFEVLVALMGYDRVLQAGDYEFAAGTPALEVIYRMRAGQTSTRSVTVVEGWQLGEIADAVAAQGVSRDDFLAAAHSHDYDYDFVRAIDPSQSLEGYLYPATYSIRASDTGRTVVEKMLAAFNDNVPAGVQESAASLGLSLHEVVTIASIIQREARVAEEKPVMAQVFLTRLRIGIPLEADPTVQYALAQDPANVAANGYWKPGLTLDDLGYDSPYNTYLYYGVPPGPICNPAADSIIAVVQPADTNYLYFVAKPDGSHAFASTLDEHQANIDQYQNSSGE